MENKNGYENLVIAIYEQAAKDYKKSSKKIKTLENRKRRNGVLTKKDEYQLTQAVYMKEECERFFMKDPYGMFTELDPKDICIELEKTLKE